MSNLFIVITILLLALTVWITRFLPFIIFKNIEKLPKIVDYLGKVLPAAMMGLLVVYCFKDYDFTDFMGLLPSLIAVAVVVALQLWRHNFIISIAAGTILYMVLIRVM